MAKGQKRGNKEAKKPKLIKINPALASERFSKGSAPSIGKSKKT